MKELCCSKPYCSFLQCRPTLPAELVLLVDCFVTKVPDLVKNVSKKPNAKHKKYTSVIPHFLVKIIHITKI